MKLYKLSQTSTAPLREPNGPMHLIRYAYFAFVFSLPFEAANIGIESGIGKLTRLLGFMFVVVALLQPSSCFRHPPKALWYFVGYLYILVLMIFWHGFEYQQEATGRLFTYSQLLVLFCISYNLMQYEHIRTRTLIVLAISCTILAAMMTLHIITLSDIDATSMSGSTVIGSYKGRQSRLTAFGANPNTIASILALGLLALIGLVFGPERRNIKTRLLAWPCLGVLAMAIVRTGSRGAVVAIMAGLLAFQLKGKGRGISTRLKAFIKRSRVKIAFAAVGVIGLVIIFSYQYELIRARWEKTLFEGQTAGRVEITREAVGMFLEKPWLGWGPATFIFELGARLGLPVRDPHNTYLWVLLETGLIGAVPFFAGLWLCCRTAWKARGGIHSVLSAGLLAAVLISGLKGSNQKSKLFWIVLAYVLASGSVAALPRMRRAASSSGQTVARIIQRRARPRFVAPVTRPSRRSPSS
jgi:O-antigen ligase